MEKREIKMEIDGTKLHKKLNQTKQKKVTFACSVSP